jgi:transposase
VAADQKRARAAGATIVFTDETGLLLAPLLRTTLAARGHTPAFEQRASHRSKVSVAGAIWKTPGGLVRVHCQTYPNGFVNADRYAEFVGDLLATRLRRTPVVLVHDNGNMHKGEPMDELADEAANLLAVEPLPPYAPELNPEEMVWNWLKYDELPNFAPADVAELDRVANAKLFALHRDQPRLRTFLANSRLKW